MNRERRKEMSFKAQRLVLWFTRFVSMVSLCMVVLVGCERTPTPTTSKCVENTTSPTSPEILERLPVLREFLNFEDPPNTTLSVWLGGPKMLRHHALTPVLPHATNAVFQGFLTECDCLKLSTPEISPLKINNLVTVTK